MVINDQQVQCPALRRIEELFPCYTNDIVGLVIKAYNEWNDSVDVYIVDYTENERLLEQGLKNGPTGRKTLRIEVKEPHSSFVNEQRRNNRFEGHVFLFRNVKTKYGKNGGFEGTMWPDKKAGRINVERLTNQDESVKEIMQRKRDFENPQSRSNKKRKRKENAEAQAQARTDGERTSKAARADQVQPAAPAANGASDSVAAAEPQPQSKSKPSLRLSCRSTAECLSVEADIRKVMVDIHSHASRFLASDNSRSRLEALHAVNMASITFSGQLLDSLNRPPRPRPDDSRDSRHLDPVHTVYLDAKISSDPVEQAMLLRAYSDLDVHRLDRPWRLTATEKSCIEFPDGFEPFPDEPGSGRLNSRVRVSNRADRNPLPINSQSNALTNPSDQLREMHATVRVLDFHPPRIADFAQRTPDGDHLEFTLLVKPAGGDPFKIWIPNAAAETLTGLTGTHVIAHDEGVPTLRARLRELWGDLELTKGAFETALDDGDDFRRRGGGGAADPEEDLDERPDAEWGVMAAGAGAPLVDLGLVVVPAPPPTDVAAGAYRWGNIARRKAWECNDDVCVVLDGTEVVLDSVR